MLAVLYSSAIATCCCCYHQWITCGVYKKHLPVFLSLVAFASAITITAG